jgi:HK97 family phage major capsid protein
MELKEQFEALTAKLEGKSLEARNEAFAAFESKMNESLAGEVKAVKEAAAEELKAVQGHLDKLDAKMQEAKSKEFDKGDELKGLITKNFDQIKEVRNGKNIELKDMTLPGNLTGDQPRDYNFNTVIDPSQKINVADLTGMVSISGGTYTFPRETGKTGDFATQVEGASKAQIDYSLEMVDVNTDFLAGFTRYSRKMKNNLPFLESFVPRALRRDYAKKENAQFYTNIAAAATSSSVTSGNKIERLIADISALENTNFDANGVVVNVADWWDIQITEKSTGAGYGLPGVVTYEGGVLRINGIAIYKAVWVPVNKYIVADWSRINKIVTEGLSLSFSDVEGTNFVANNITARMEAQIALAVEQPDAVILGDFTAV